MPAMSADSEWPWPDIRWHEPQASVIPGPPCHRWRRGGMFIGKPVRRIRVSGDLGGLVFLRAAGRPHNAFHPTAVGWILSGMLNAQSGSPAGTVSTACAVSCRTMRSGARAHTSTEMRTDVLFGGFGGSRRISSPVLDPGRLSISAAARARPPVQTSPAH